MNESSGPLVSAPQGEVLQHVPARLLLDQLLTPMLGIDLDGVVVYANPACARLLGHRSAAGLQSQPLTALLPAHAQTPPTEIIDLLRAENTVVQWRHADGYRVPVLVADAMILHDCQPMLMVSLRDVTECLWSGPCRAALRRA